MKIERTITLNNGVSMPTLGLGVWQMKEGEETENAVREAFQMGYRLVDTAKLYGNEAGVGRAVRTSGIPREEVFVTTKLWPTDFMDVEGAFERSFRKLDIGYIDLYLIHHPIGLVPGLGNIRNKIWKTFEKLYAEKRVRAIGVSNYDVEQMKEVLAHCAVPPAVNQIQFNPFSYAEDILRFCTASGIAVEAYSPLAQGRNLNNVLIREIAGVHKKSPAQIMIRWALQHHTIVIPKSSRKERMKENMEVFDFDLSADEMTALDSLS